MRKNFGLALFLLASALGAVQTDSGTIDRIIDEGKNHNQVMKHLDHLTHKIGARLTGSTNLQKACDWTAAQFKSFGLKNVHLEQWGEIPVGFDRGKTQVARMVEPFDKDFEFTTPSWSAGTNGPVRGKPMLEPKTMDEFRKVEKDLKGAWLIMKGQPQRGARGVPPPPEDEVTKAINASGLAGKVYGSRNDLTITGGRYQNVKWESLPKDVRVTIRKKDMDAIMRSLDKGRDVVLEFNLENKFLKGPRPVYNVVAEIPGTEKPEEVVIVSGHLDSWDGPGSQGALDNGTGIMCALEAARILAKVGAKPKRTIRFIGWTGEEQGLLGSRSYVAKHMSEMDKISAVLVDDGGTNYEGGVSCIESMAPMLREAIEPTQKAFPDMPMQIRVTPTFRQPGGSDHMSFNSAGVPGFFWDETGRSDYNYVHHTQHDRFEMAIPEYLVQSSTNEAVVAYYMACAPTMLPRVAQAPKAGG